VSKITEYFDRIKEMIERGGPEPSEYDFVKNIPIVTGITLRQEADIYKIISPILEVGSILGHTFQKPYGYAGDFELIDKIYTEWVSEDKRFQKWDKIYHNLECAIAVRNRKKYFIYTLNKFNLKNPYSKVLNLGSGPCTDLAEYLIGQKANNKLKFDCLDMDPKAIEYGSTACDNFSDKVSFIEKNVFRFRAEYEYDLVWSAGLFDYFSDKLFVRLLNRMYGLLSDNGEMVIGNFSTENPSRAMMEVFAQWYLHHRDKELLKDLAIRAGISSSKITVRSEELGVNLFLHIKK